MPEPLHVLLATDSAEPSGLGRHMLTLAQELSGNHRVTLAFLETVSDAGAAARAAGLDVRSYADPGALLAAVRPGLLHVHAGIGWEGHALTRAGAAARLPVVRTEHLPWLVTDQGQESEFAAAAAGVDAFVAVSDAAASSWAPVLARLAPGARLAAIPNGVAPPAVMRSRAETRAALGVAAGASLLLSVGRFTPQKDQITLIRAVRSLADPALRLILAGDGPERDACVAAAAGDDRIAFLGQRDDVGDLMAGAELLVLPSRFEGLPLVALEAMALGLPVVASRIDSVREALGPAHPFLAEPGDPADFATAISVALATPRDLVAAHAQRRHARHFTAARAAADTAALYRAVIDRPRSRTRKSPMSHLRVGFVGAGGIAHRHFGVLATMDDVTIAGIADPDAARARDAAERTGARAFADQDAMIDALDLDALFLCVPPFAHGVPERAALAAGLPFLVEKPLSLDADLAADIDAAVRRTGLITATGYHWRYLDTVDEARRLLADNPAHLMSGYWLDQTPPSAWWHRTGTSGGQIVEQATHIIDLARFLAGDVTEVFGLTASRPRSDFPGLDVATASTAALRFASGAIANLSATCLLRWNHRVGLHVFADGLALELTDHDIMVDTGHGRPVRGADGDPVWRQDRAFLDAVAGRENRIRASYSDSLETHLVALAVARSARDGVAVRMEGLRADPQPPFRAVAGTRARVA